MASTMHRQTRYWLIAAAIFFVALYLLGNVITPFIVGAAIAYFLDPLADRLQRWGLSRTLATVIISFTVLALTVLLFLAVIPTLANQMTQLVNAAPQIFDRFQTFLVERFPSLQNADSPVRQAIQSMGETVKTYGADLVQTIFTSALGVIGVVLFMVVVPVVAFYLLLDWDRMIGSIDRLLPRDHASTIRALARDIDKVLAAFVRGQLSVCVVMGIFYAATLFLAGLDFGLIVGAIAGAITFIPYVGALIGGVLAIGLALFQFWGDWLHIFIVAAIFGFGQFMEGNVITPRLVGGSVGLHPVILLFALSAFGAVFGFVGLLVAVPVAAALGVFARYGIDRYRGSVMYTGVAAPGEEITLDRTTPEMRVADNDTATLRAGGPERAG